VAQLDGYDLVLIDTPPDYLRRPYATHTLLMGGVVVLPCPPGARERMGVGHMLEHFRETCPNRLDHCALIFVEPERGVTVKVQTILPIFGSRYPEVRALGTVPRAPRLASLSDEHDGYISLYDLGPHTTFIQAAHRIVGSLTQQIGVTPRLPMPKIGAWAALRGRLRGERIDVPAANTSVGALAREQA
jgi:cellulose biosynthesis protein BcsQ